MKKHESLHENVDHTQDSSAFLDAGNWWKRWKEGIMVMFSGFSHTLFGYRHDPGRLGMPKNLSPLVVQVTLKPNIKKANGDRPSFSNQI